MHRVLIKTHHMRSRAKINAITKAGRELACSVILKSGAPGIMIGEGEQALKWMEAVRVCQILISDSVKAPLMFVNRNLDIKTITCLRKKKLTKQGFRPLMSPAGKPLN